MGCIDLAVGLLMGRLMGLVTSHAKAQARSLRLPVGDDRPHRISHGTHLYTHRTSDMTSHGTSHGITRGVHRASHGTSHGPCHLLWEGLWNSTASPIGTRSVPIYPPWDLMGLLMGGDRLHETIIRLMDPMGLPMGLPMGHPHVISSTGCPMEFPMGRSIRLESNAIPNISIIKYLMRSPIYSLRSFLGKRESHGMFPGSPM